MQFSIKLDHKHEHKGVPVPRPMPFMGKHIEDAKTGEQKEHPQTDGFKAQVEEDLTWAFGVATRASGDVRLDALRFPLAVEIFRELRRWRWNASPGTAREFVEYKGKLEGKHFDLEEVRDPGKVPQESGGESEGEVEHDLRDPGGGKEASDT